METRKEFTAEEQKAISPMEKIALITCMDDEGNPHISLITSLIAISPDRLTIGEFCQGRSKVWMQQNRDVAFCILTLQGYQVWRGRARWTGSTKEGPELEAYKQTPMHRYNAYFPVHTVHYFDLVEAGPREKLSIPALVGPIAATMTARIAVGRRIAPADRILTPYGMSICAAPVGLRWLSWIGEDRWPRIVPVHQCMAADSRRLVFTGGSYKKELKEIPDGTVVAVFSAKMSLENLLVRGRFNGFRQRGLVRSAVVDIDWVYNSMPPNADRIYPPLPLEAVGEYH